MIAGASVIVKGENDMLKWYADITELDEAAVTPSALRRIYILLVLSVPFLPLMNLGHLGYMDGGKAAELFYWSAFLISAVATVCLFLTRIVYRAWVQDKYLDEWEMAVKHKSMSVGFMFLTYTLALLFGVGFANFDFGAQNQISIGVDMLGFAAIGAVFFGLYIQIIQQLAMLQPMDDDDFSGVIDASIRPVITGIAVAIFVPLILVAVGAFAAGFIDELFFVA